MTPDRYHRQMLLPGIGTAGQASLAGSCVLLVGCGALGCVVADQLARAGVGRLRLVDRDVVELTNLQRQVLFDEADARDETPKAAAAAKRLAAVNSSVKTESCVVDLHSGNIEQLADGVHLILDGTDNVETRYLLNDFSVKRNIPWVYGACVGTIGRVMIIRPGQGPCLRCIFPQPPTAGDLPTCDTAGVLGPAAAMVGAMQAVAALQFLSGHEQQVSRELLTMDVWAGRFRGVNTGDRRPDCPCCGLGQFEFLNRTMEQSAVQLCGRNTVQIRPGGTIRPDLARLAERLSSAGTVQTSSFLVRCELTLEPPIQLTIFADGRTLVQGTHDLARARTLVSRYVGS